MVNVISWVWVALTVIGSAASLFMFAVSALKWFEPDFGMDIAKAFAAITFTCLLLPTLMLWGLRETVRMREEAPCSDFRNFPAQQVPLRCLER